MSPQQIHLQQIRLQQIRLRRTTPVEPSARTTVIPLESPQRGLDGRSTSSRETARETSRSIERSDAAAGLAGPTPLHRTLTDR